MLGLFVCLFVGDAVRLLSSVVCVSASTAVLVCRDVPEGRRPGNREPGRSFDLD